jgi:phospholipase C
MSDFLNGIWTRGADAAIWLHQSIKEIPTAGRTYELFTEEVAIPVWNTACDVKEAAIPFFQKSWNYTKAKAIKHPRWASAFGVALAFVLILRLKRHIEEERKLQEK